MPHLLQAATKCSLALSAASPPDRHGYFSLGTNAEYVAALVRRVRIFRSLGGESIHIVSLPTLPLRPRPDPAARAHPTARVPIAGEDALTRAVRAALNGGAFDCAEDEVDLRSDCTGAASDDRAPAPRRRGQPPKPTRRPSPSRWFRAATRAPWSSPRTTASWGWLRASHARRPARAHEEDLARLGG